MKSVFSEAVTVHAKAARNNLRRALRRMTTVLTRAFSASLARSDRDGESIRHEQWCSSPFLCSIGEMRLLIIDRAYRSTMSECPRHGSRAAPSWLSAAVSDIGMYEQKSGSALTGSVREGARNGGERRVMMTQAQPRDAITN